MERPASPPRPHEEAEIDFDDEEEDPEEVEPWFTSSSDSEPEREPKRPAPPPTPSPAPAWTEPEQQPAPITAEADKKGDGEEDARPRWPGWPGASVFRLVVPADKVGGVIGRRGETIKRLCDETRARVRVLDAPLGASSQIVRLPLLPSAKFCFVPATGFYGLYL
jgi:poly(rC)-binding protein 2/3/4